MLTDTLPRRWFRFAAIPICALAMGADGPSEKNAAVLEAVQGVWAISEYEIGGHVEHRSIGEKIVFSGNKIQTLSGEPRGTIQIDATHDPMHIDFFAPKRGGNDGAAGIFALDRDTLIIIYSLGQRPKKIEDGGGMYFMKFKRRPEPPPAPPLTAAIMNLMARDHPISNART